MNDMSWAMSSEGFAKPDWEWWNPEPLMVDMVFGEDETVPMKLEHHPTDGMIDMKWAIPSERLAKPEWE